MRCGIEDRPYVPASGECIAKDCSAGDERHEVFQPCVAPGARIIITHVLGGNTEAARESFTAAFFLSLLITTHLHDPSALQLNAFDLFVFRLLSLSLLGFFALALIFLSLFTGNPGSSFLFFLGKTITLCFLRRSFLCR
ncbi:hypothetical protein N7523_003755 [Penicillium sp. IBT 18751x]|nr:hypothetical protein N7523_003755 [Penicillium sp. IBT 18751x]